MAVEIYKSDLIKSINLVLSNSKDCAQVKKDLLEGKCIANVLPFPFYSYDSINLLELQGEEIKFVTYYNNQVFYKKGNEFQTMSLIEALEKAYSNSFSR